MKSSLVRWSLRLTLQLAILGTIPHAFGNDHEDYMEHPDLETEAIMYEATTAPRVSFQELPYFDEGPISEEYESEYTSYETP